MFCLEFLQCQSCDFGSFPAPNFHSSISGSPKRTAPPGMSLRGAAFRDVTSRAKTAILRAFLTNLPTSTDEGMARGMVYTVS